MSGMPNEQSKMGSGHWEKSQEELGVTSNLRYTNEPNPEYLHKSQRELSNYVKKNQMKY